MEFMGPPMGWYDPPNLHEICSCDGCHEAGEHTKDIEYWAKVEDCWACVDTLDKAVDNLDYCLYHHGWYCELFHDAEGPNEVIPGRRAS